MAIRAALSICFLGAIILTVLTSCQAAPQHPRVLLTAEDLPALVAKTTAAGPDAHGVDAAKAWKDILAKADFAATAPAYSYSVNIPLDNRKFAGMWSYTLSDQTPPRHDDSPAYPPWTAMFQERSDSITTRLMHLSFAALVTGEDKYFQRAREMALHLSNWDQWTDPSYSGGRLRACLDTGHCTGAVAMFYDWCHDKLSQADRDKIRRAIIEKGIEACLADVDRYPPATNGYAVVLSGATLGAIAVQPETPAADQWIATCIEKARVGLDQGGEDGGAFEGPMYGTYLLDSLVKCLEAFETAGIEQDLFDHPYLSTMTRYCVGLLAPDTLQMPCFGDGGPGIGFPQTMSVLAHRGDNEAAWYLQQVGRLGIETIYDFIRYDARSLQPEQPGWNPSTVFEDVGYAVLRDGFNAEAPTLFFKSGPYEENIGHNHYDHNAFVLTYGGEWVIPDRGYHSFYDPTERKFSLGSMGHCTVVMDIDDEYYARNIVPDPGHEQVNRTGGRITEFFAGGAFDFVTGEAAEAYNKPDLKVLDRFSRSILYVKPNFFVIMDDLQSPEPRSFNLLIHADGAGDVEPKGDHFILSRTTGEVWGKISSPDYENWESARYPGAEKYGPYLRAWTSKTASTRFTTFLYPRPSSSPDFIRNGGFERGLSGWQPRAGEDGPNHSVVTQNPAEGDQCASIVNSGYYYSDRFRLPAGSDLTARAMIRTTELPEGKGATMTLYFWRGGKAFANKRIGPFSHEDWQEHSITATVPEDTEEVSLALEFFAPGTAWFDAARVDAPVQERTIVTPVVEALDDGALDGELGGQRFVILRAPGEANGVATDADCAAVVFDGAGKPARCFIKNGKFLRVDGSDLIAFDRPCTAEVIFAGANVTLNVRDDLAPHAAPVGAVSVDLAQRADSATVNGQNAALQATETGVRVTVK